nr:MAG TPA: hypothetical protein [Caudoviricetes sp.]
MALHEVQLKGYSVRPGNLSLGTFDSYGIEQLHVTADDSWDGLDILAVFHAPNGDAKKVVVGADGMLNVPPEATAKQAGNGRIVFVGLAENVQRITVDMGYNTKTHSDIEGDNPGVPTPDVVQQILENSNHAVSIATAAQVSAENARLAAEDAAKKAGEESGGAAYSAVAAKKSAEDAAASSKIAAGKAEASASSANVANESAKASQAAQSSAESSAQSAAKSARAAADSAASIVGAQEQSAASAYAARNFAQQAKKDSDSAAESASASKEAATQAIENNTSAADSAANAEAAKTAAAESATAAAKSAADANRTANSIKDSMTQIAANKEAVSQLKEDTTALQKRQNVLVGSETGNPIAVDDAFAAQLCGLTAYGKSTQGNTTGAQLFDVSNADVVHMYIANSGIGNYIDNYSVIIPIKPSTSYTISEKNNKVFRVAITEEYPVEAALTLFKDATTIYKNTTTPNNLPNGNFLMIQLYGNFTNTPDFSGLMLNEGTTTKPWEPYTGGKPSPSLDYPQEIKSAGDSGSVVVKVTGKNLFYEQEFQEYFINSAGNTVGLDTGNVSCVLQVVTGAKYYVTRNKIGTKFRVAVVDKLPTSGNPVTPSSGINADSKRQAEISATSKYMVIQCEDEAAFSGLMVSLDSSTTYSPYHEQLLTLPTPNGLPGIPVTSGGNYTDQNGQQWICDEVDLGRGVKVQRVYKVDVDGENVKFEQAGDYANLLPRGLPNALYSNGQKIYAISTFTSLSWFFNTANGQFLYLIATNISDQINTSCKKQLGKIYYALATPIETPLTPAEIAAYKALTAYAPDTVVQASDDAGIKLDYQRDVNLVVKNLEDAIASMTTTT